MNKAYKRHNSTIDLFTVEHVYEINFTRLRRWLSLSIIFTSLIEKRLDMTILQCILECTKPTKGQNRHYKTMKTKPCNQHADAMKTIYFIAVLKGLHFTV